MELSAYAMGSLVEVDLRGEQIQMTHAEARSFMYELAAAIYSSKPHDESAAPPEGQTTAGNLIKPGRGIPFDQMRGER